MKQKLQIRVQKDSPGNDGLFSYKKTKLKSRLLHRLLGSGEEVTIIVPGKKVASIEVMPADSGGEADAR